MPPSQKVDSHTLPQPDMTKTMQGRCCCGVECSSADFPQRCAKCGHFWCEHCCDWYSVVGNEGLKVSK